MNRKLVKQETLLRRPCEPCSSVAEGLRIGRELLDFVRKYNRERLTSSAAGLAAPQLGILKQVCVITLDPKRPLVLVNPTVMGASARLVPWEESCISLPGKRVWTMRHTWVEVQALNFGAQTFGLKFSIGPKHERKKLLESVCAQHEIAHCLGLLIDDFQNEETFHEVVERKGCLKPFSLVYGPSSSA